MSRIRPGDGDEARDGHDGTSWMTFLTNHRDVLAAMEFFTVPTLTFRLLHVILVIQHCRRKIVHVNVTQHKRL